MLGKDSICSIFAQFFKFYVPTMAFALLGSKQNASILWQSSTLAA